MFKGTNGGNNKNIVMYTYVVATDDVLSRVNARYLSLLDSLVSHYLGSCLFCETNLKYPPGGDGVVSSLNFFSLLLCFGSVVFFLRNNHS